MGHEIRYLRFSGRYGKERLYAECNALHKELGEYHTRLSNLRFPTDRIFNNYNEAEKYINDNDRDWYDQIAVKYKEKTKTMWLAKIEYHV